MEGVTVTSGSALARTPDDAALIVADEDHHVLRVLSLPVDVKQPPVVVDMPGAPAQVLALGDRVLVTVREPGLLLEFHRDGTALHETGRVALPWDAWGVAVTADGKTAVVSSAWTHRITGVDLTELKVRWSVNAAREPRGIAIGADGVAYVGHLVGSRLSKIEDLASTTPKLTRFDVTPSPMRTAPDELLDASNTFALVLSPRGDRLFVPRHALGAQGDAWWYGDGTVDAITTKDFVPLSPKAAAGALCDFGGQGSRECDENAVVPSHSSPFVAPRAAVYRTHSDTLLVASEGTNELVELDARALDPSLAVKRTHNLEKREGKEAPLTNVVISGGAPEGIALSADEKTAFVFCRSTYDLAIVPLDDDSPMPMVHLADDTLDDTASRGRRLFYDAADRIMSGGMSCAGCHPEGRDDGHVWHEIVEKEDDRANGYRGRSVAMPSLFGQPPQIFSGFARQTPMLAGRLASPGPYGWRGESPDIETRLHVGFGLHRWQGREEDEYGGVGDRPKLIAAFVRKGLVAPGAAPHETTEEERLGEQIFKRTEVGCSRCHNPDTNFTSHDLVELDRSHPAGVDPEKGTGFKVPSLLYVGGTPPYYRDALVNSLDDLVNNNANAMGDTRSLDAKEKSALIAYLRTIGGYVEPFPSDDPPKRVPIPNDYASSTHPGRLPQHAEWLKAEVVGKVGDCTVHKLRVFFGVDCPEAHGMSTLAGTTTGTEGWSKPSDFTIGANWHVFSIEPGDRRLFEVFHQESHGRWGTTDAPDGVIQAFWLPDDKAPTLIIEGSDGKGPR